MILDKYNIIFWDFDGVIKDSIEVKTKAFYHLFIEFGDIIANKVKKHHLEHGGMSRFEKIPIYLEWANQEISDKKINFFCERFSSMVCQEVINSPWVEGVEKVILNKPKRQKYILVSATPQKEIEIILQEIKIASFFDKVYGAPSSKKKVIEKELKRYNFPLSKFVMIGDAESDYEAAKYSNISFILRKHTSNRNLAKNINATIITNFK